MQTIERHGGGSHVVRPDRVYRTGVLSSTMGYDPGADVQSVASAFTQYPIDLSLPPGGGLGGLGYYQMAPTFPLNGLRGPIANLRARFQLWNMRRKAKRALSGLGWAAQTGQYMPGGSYANVGQQYSPAFMAKANMVAHLTSGQGGMPQAYAQSQVGTSLNLWDNRWWNG